MEFEAILREVGDFGRYQRSLLFKFMIPATFASAFYVLNVIFMTATPEHRCAVPALEALNLSEPSIRAMSVPKGARCVMYARDYDALAERYRTAGLPDPAEALPPAPVVPCTHGWHYSRDWYEETIVSQWDLVCDRNYLPSLVLTLANAGSVVGTSVFSFLADRHGRKCAFLANIAVASVTGVLSVFSPTFAVFAILRTLTGATVPANFQLPYIITVEQVGARQRAWLVCISWMLWTLGACALALVAYLSRHWATLGLVTTLPVTAFLAYDKFLKPSPRFLMTQDKCEEASDIIGQIARVNEKSVPADLLPKLKKISENAKSEEASSTEHSVLDLFRYPQLRKKVFVVTLNWSAVAVAYFGLTLNVTNLGRNDFLNFFLLASVELPAFPIALGVMQKLGRRWSSTLFVMLTGIACLVPSFLARDAASSAVAASMLGKFGSAAAFMVVYQQAAELYPTPVRALGMGVGSTVSSLAVICMPYVCYLGSYNRAIPFLIIGALCVCAGLLAPLVPETLNRRLPQTLQDSEEFATGRGCFSCGSNDASKGEDESEAQDPTPV